MSDLGDPKLYELSIIRVIQEFTTELAAVKSMTDAQTIAIKAHVDTSQHEFRSEITRTMMQLDLGIIELRREQQREAAELRAAQARETTERAKRQVENDARAAHLTRRLDRNSIVLAALTAAIVVALGALWMIR